MRYGIFGKDYFWIWGVLVLVGLACRPLMPVDETRAVSVAWEMWRRGDFLVPFLNGEPYSHKPPLLQWLIQAGWRVFGVNEWSARVTAPLFALGNLMLTERLAHRLWPDAASAARIAPLLLLGAFAWALWGSLTVYDMLVTFFTLAALLGLLDAAEGRALRGFSVTGLAIGGGLLSKGPVVLLLVLPMALCAPWWWSKPSGRSWAGWYLGALGALALGALIVLCWAVPAGWAGGEDYRNAIFWGQSAGRVADSFAHKHSWWWYGLVLPPLTLPWIAWPPVWRALRRAPRDWAWLFCLAHVLAVLLLLSLVSGKQPHYLLPMLPSLALLAAGALARGAFGAMRREQRIIGGLWLIGGIASLLAPLLLSGELAAAMARVPKAAQLLPVAAGLALLFWKPRDLPQAVRGIALASVTVLIAAHLAFFTLHRTSGDLRPMAGRLAEAERSGAVIAHWENYHGEYQFLGRLASPLVEIYGAFELQRWLREHPQAYVLFTYRSAKRVPETDAAFVQDYRGSRRVGLWPAAVLLDKPALVQLLTE